MLAIDCRCSIYFHASLLMCIFLTISSLFQYSNRFLFLQFRAILIFWLNLEFFKLHSYYQTNIFRLTCFWAFIMSFTLRFKMRFKKKMRFGFNLASKPIRCMCDFPCNHRLVPSNFCPETTIPPSQLRWPSHCNGGKNNRFEKCTSWSEEIKKLPIFWEIYRARDVATFMRFGHLTKPSRRFTSRVIVVEHVRTVEISMTFRSNPLHRRESGREREREGERNASRTS